MKDLPDQLHDLAARGLERRLRPLASGSGPKVREGGRSLVNLASNNYLGLATDPRVVAAAREALERYGAGSGASRLISGDLDLHHGLEADLADFKSAPASLVFPTGYAAASGTVAAIAGEDDVIFSDELNHASLIDGCRLAPARVVRFRHRDPEHLRALLANEPCAGRRLVVTDGVFSMDGELAPLPELVAVAAEFDARVVVDDAHGTGVIGGEGTGSVERFGLGADVDVRIGTLSKALGAQGGFVVGSEVLVDWLVHRARTFVYSTGLGPAMVAAAAESLRIVRAEPERRAALRENARRLREGLLAKGHRLIGDEEVPMAVVVLGSPDAAVTVAETLRDRGILAPAIRPPTVPEGTSRIRLTPMATHTPDDIDAAAAAFPEA
ncbi:MAG: 8-amino-7-oxononanoate synthase [Planctomycetota bacterium]